MTHNPSEFPDNDFDAEFKQLTESIEPSEASELTRSIEDFDQAEGAMIDTITEAFVYPEDKAYHDNLSITSLNLLTAFSNCLDTICKELDDTKQRASLTIQLMMSEKEKFTTVILPLAQCDDINSSHLQYIQEDLRKIVNKVYKSKKLSSNKERSDKLLELFAQGIQVDLDHAIQHIELLDKERKQEAELLEQKQLLKSKIGKNVLDIIKIAVGVAGGIIIANHINKRP